MRAVKVRVKGAVQGVGFRPFCYRQALRLGLLGYVLNDLGGVFINLEGSSQAIEEFLETLRSYPPPASRITGIEVEETQIQGFKEFRIVESKAGHSSQALEVSADLATCEACRSEILYSRNRRYRYAFTNCTDCGPRYTIIRDLPYDRPKTTMVEFRMCEDCQHEYEEPLDRRFHAQPNACKVCGPDLVLLDAWGRVVRCSDPIAETAHTLSKGGIAAVKGLGGYHLMCDAADPEVIKKLRSRKQRPAKALALMCPDIEHARTLAVIGEEEEAVLCSPAAPILLLKWAKDVPVEIREAIAPFQPGVGVMLAYTPLHHLLFEELSRKEKRRSFSQALVATSANKGDEPIIADELELFSKLRAVFDVVLTHNRRIENRIDDSVGYINPIKSCRSPKSFRTLTPRRVSPRGELHLVRRARGFAPQPFEASFEFPAALAVGAEMKGSFAISDGRHVWLSPHIGEMTNRDTIEFFEETLKKYLGWFRVKPEVVACDMHPDYLSTRWAEKYSQEQRIPLVQIQHHHAHIAAVMLEHRLEEPVIGLALDGTGYSPQTYASHNSGDPDGRLATSQGNASKKLNPVEASEVWGCELLVVGDCGAHFRRLGHLKPLPLVGGELAIRRPRRMAAGVVADLFGSDKAIELFGEEGRMAARLLDPGVGGSLDGLQESKMLRTLRVLRASSAGRLFDAVAGLLGLVDEISFEAQAAVALEALCPPDLEFYPGYPFEITNELVLDPRPCFSEILSDLAKKREPSFIAARFHVGLKDALLSWTSRAREITGISKVVLSGGVFANRTLMRILEEDADDYGFEFSTPCLIPASDGGVAAGQIQVAASLARLSPSNAQTT